MAPLPDPGLHRPLGAGLRVLLEREASIAVVDEAASGDETCVAVMLLVRLLGRGGRLRAPRPRRKQPAREAPMITPKVTELTRGCAHPGGTGPAKTSVTSRQRG